jgi:alpha-glucuronidase
MGIGFNRTKTGSNAVSQYHEPLCSQFNDLQTCPEIYLLWFHHLSWDYKMKSGHTLWDEMCYHYDNGVKQVLQFQKVWNNVTPFIDNERFVHIQSKLHSQSENAQIWKDACLLYFQQFSRKPIPSDIEQPVYKLDDLIEMDLK